MEGLISREKKLIRLEMIFTSRHGTSQRTYKEKAMVAIFGPFLCKRIKKSTFYIYVSEECFHTANKTWKLLEDKRQVCIEIMYDFF